MDILPLDWRRRDEWFPRMLPRHIAGVGEHSGWEEDLGRVGRMVTPTIGVKTHLGLRHDFIAPVDSAITCL